MGNQTKAYEGWEVYAEFNYKTFTGENMISIYRYINNISLNGKEYLLDEENQVLKFTNEKQAFNFLSDGGVEAKDEEELEEYGIYFETEEKNG